MLKLSSSAKSDSKLNTQDRHIRKKEKNHSRKPNYDLKFERKFQAKDHRRKFPRRTPNRQTPLSDPVSKQEQMDRMLRLKKRTKYELMMEAFHVANLFYYMNETSISAEMDTFYIISTNWFDKWKTYVNFDYFMENTNKFLKLKDKDRSPCTSENFLTELDEEIKKEIGKYFDSFFLLDNSDSFPGVISNKELIYDKGMCYIDLENLKSHLNYNVVEQCQIGRDYIIISEQIWRYFKTVYSGKEIKRYKVKLPLPTFTNELMIETKLKNILICLTRFKKSNGVIQRLAERPKLVFYPRRKSLYDLKKHLLDIFSFLNDCSARDVRLWILDAKFNFDLFEEYLMQHLSETNYDFQEEITFPGFNLDLMDKDVLIGEIDEIIQNRIIVLEYVDNNTHSNFIFRQQYLSEFSKEIRDTIRVIQSKSKEPNAQMNLINCYDRIVYKNNDEDEQNLFHLSDYFLKKYGMIDKHYPYPSYTLNLNDPEEEAVLLNEIEGLRGNMHLIFEKGELLQKFSYCYTNPINSITSVMNKDNFPPSQDTKLISRHDLIIRKRERTKILDHMLRKLPETEEKQNLPSTQGHLDITPKEEISLPEENEADVMICNYCSKEIEEEYEECDKCKMTKYCNKLCKTKDLRFHKVKCLN